MLHWMPTISTLSDKQRPAKWEARDVSIRLATPADAVAIARLAALDSSRPPVGPTLLGEIDGRLWAALGVDDRHAIADPFRPSGDVVALLRARAEHVRGDPAHDGHAALRPRLAA